MNDDRWDAGIYVVGKRCTFHAPREALGGGDCCPHCLDELVVVTTEGWEAEVRKADQANPGYAAMIAWSRGKCFPDVETMQNAWRQAMEGES